MAGRGYRIYNWEGWFSAGDFTLRKGVEYSCSVASMTQQIRNHASRHGIPISISEKDGNITVKVIKRRGLR